MRVLSLNLVLPLLVIELLFYPADVDAANPYVNTAEMQRLTHEARVAWWSSLSPRQKSLERSLEKLIHNHKKKTGQAFIVANRYNLIIVMRTIGARHDERDFVWVRLRYHARLGQEVQKIDRFLGYARRNPQWYLPPHMRGQ